MEILLKFHSSMIFIIFIINENLEIIYKNQMYTDKNVVLTIKKLIRKIKKVVRKNHGSMPSYEHWNHDFFFCYVVKQQFVSS